MMLFCGCEQSFSATYVAQEAQDDVGKLQCFSIGKGLRSDVNLLDSRSESLQLLLRPVHHFLAVRASIWPSRNTLDSDGFAESGNVLLFISIDVSVIGEQRMLQKLHHHRKNYNYKIVNLRKQLLQRLWQFTHLDYSVINRTLQCFNKN